MHGRRESQIQYENTYARLVKDFGERCNICKRKIGDAYPKEITIRWKIGSRILALQIEHKNGQPHDCRYENKQLSCEACNLIKSLRNDSLRRALSDAMRASHDGNDVMRALNDGVERASDGGVERERERESMGAIRQTVERKNWSLEALVSYQAKKRFREYIDRVLKEKGKLEWQAALNEGACITDGSQQSIERYLKAWCSAPGHLRYETDQDTLEKFVMLKEKPKEGE